MSFVKSSTFKYVKNLIIGLGAATVLMGALFKLESWEGASEMLIIGLTAEAFIFLFLGIIGPEKDYYWEKLYPGLDKYNSNIAPLTDAPASATRIQPAPQLPALNGEVVEQQLGGMLSELQTMSRSLSSLKALQEVDFLQTMSRSLSSLKALQEVDFSGTKDQIRSMSNFYSKLNEAMADLADSVEETKQYKDNLSALNKNIGSLNQTYSALNSVYGNVISAMAGVKR